MNDIELSDDLELDIRKIAKEHQDKYNFSILYMEDGHEEGKLAEDGEINIHEEFLRQNGGRPIYPQVMFVNITEDEIQRIHVTDKNELRTKGGRGLFNEWKSGKLKWIPMDGSNDKQDADDLEKIVSRSTWYQNVIEKERDVFVHFRDSRENAIGERFSREYYTVMQACVENRKDFRMVKVYVDKNDIPGVKIDIWPQLWLYREDYKDEPVKYIVDPYNPSYRASLLKLMEENLTVDLVVPEEEDFLEAHKIVEKKFNKRFERSKQEREERKKKQLEMFEEEDGKAKDSDIHKSMKKDLKSEEDSYSVEL